jgi:hypothetical protein
MAHGLLLHNVGAAKTPYRMIVAPDLLSAKVEKVIVASRSGADRFLADLVNATSWVGLEATARGWTITHYNGTALGSDSAGTPGTTSNVAVVSGSTVTTMLRRARATRTTALDSLRGFERVFLRARGTVAGDVWKVRGMWSPSLADPAFKSNDVRTLTVDTLYHEVDLGDVELPLRDALGGVAVEVWAQRVSGTGNLHLDLARLLPSGPGDVLTAVVVPGAATESTLGKDLTTPVSDPSAGGTGVVSGSKLLLDSSTDMAGIGPNTGLGLPAGRHRWRWRLESPGDDPMTVTLAVRRIGAPGTDVATQTFEVEDPSGGGPWTAVYVIEYDVADGNLYQAQVRRGGIFQGYVQEATHEFRPVVSQTQEVHTEPDTGLVHQRDFVKQILAELETEGPVPLLLPPGPAAVFVIPIDIDDQSLDGESAWVEAAGAPRRYT